MQLTKVIGVKDVCAAINVSKATLYRMINSGNFPGGIETSPGRVGWPENAVQRWIEERPKRHTEKPGADMATLARASP